MSEGDGGGGGVAGGDAGDELGGAEGEVGGGGGGLQGEGCVGARLYDSAVEIEVGVEYGACAGCEGAGQAAGEGGGGGRDGLDAGTEGEGGGGGGVGIKSDGIREMEWKRSGGWVERSVGAQLRDGIGERGGGLGAGKVEGERQGDGECEGEMHRTFKIIMRVDSAKTALLFELENELRCKMAAGGGGGWDWRQR